VRCDRRVARLARDADRLERLRERPDLVELDQDGVRDALFDALAQDRRVRHEQVVSHELGAGAQPASQRGPAVPVVLGEAILDRHHRVARDPVLPESDHLLRREAATFTC